MAVRSSAFAEIAEHQTPYTSLHFRWNSVDVWQGGFDGSKFLPIIRFFTSIQTRVKLSLKLCFTVCVWLWLCAHIFKCQAVKIYRRCCCCYFVCNEVSVEWMRSNFEFLLKFKLLRAGICKFGWGLSYNGKLIFPSYIFTAAFEHSTCSVWLERIKLRNIELKTPSSSIWDAKQYLLIGCQL